MAIGQRASNHLVVSFQTYLNFAWREIPSRDCPQLVSTQLVTLARSDQDTLKTNTHRKPFHGGLSHVRPLAAPG